MGRSPLHYACLQFGQECAIAEKLIEAGAQWNSEDVVSHTNALHIASRVLIITFTIIIFLKCKLL